MAHRNKYYNLSEENFPMDDENESDQPKEKIAKGVCPFSPDKDKGCQNNPEVDMTGKRELPCTFVPPNLPSRCTWNVTKGPKESPHTHLSRTDKPRPKICPDILHSVGETPLVRLNKIPKEERISCQVLAKCEFMNPGGSVKDRIAVRMIEEAEKTGKIRPGDTLVEPSSGNTGIGLAVAAAVRGYNLIVVLPDKNSQEKEDILRGLGAQIVRTPTKVKYDDPTGVIAVSQQIAAQIPQAFILDQYRNAGNPLAHYDMTAEEILEQCDGKIDMLVAGAGTGGTLTGVGRKIKEKCPSCIIVAVDPEGSTLAEPVTMNETTVIGYHVEGIGYDFIPTVLDQGVVDKWVKSNDKDSFIMARRLIREEGLLCGGSSGAALFGAIRAIKEAQLGEGQKCVVILPDGVRNYMTKFLNDDWMIQRDFMDPPSATVDGAKVDLPQSEKVKGQNVNVAWWKDKNVGQLLQRIAREMTTLPSSMDVKNAVAFLKNLQGFDFCPVLDEKENLMGVISLHGLLNALLSKDLSPSSPIESAVDLLNFARVTPSTTLSKLAHILRTRTSVIVVPEPNSNLMKTVSKGQPDKTNGNSVNSNSIKGSDLLGILSQMDLVNFITNPD